MSLIRQKQMSLNKLDEQNEYMIQFQFLFFLVMTRALKASYHKRPNWNLALAQSYKGDSKQVQDLSSSHWQSKMSWFIYLRNSSAQFFLSGIIMIPFPPTLSFYQKTRQRSRTGHPKQTMSLPTIRSQVLGSFSLSLQSNTKLYTFQLFFNKFDFIVYTTRGWQSLIYIHLHSVHFFIVMPAIPTPEPSSRTYLFLNKAQFNIAYLAKIIPASHIFKPSNP